VTAMGTLSKLPPARAIDRPSPWAVTSDRAAVYVGAGEYLSPPAHPRNKPEWSPWTREAIPWEGRTPAEVEREWAARAVRERFRQHEDAPEA